MGIYQYIYMSICYAIVSVCLSYFRLVCDSFDSEDCVGVLTYSHSVPPQKLKEPINLLSISVCLLGCVVCLLNSIQCLTIFSCMSPFVCQYQESASPNRMGPCGRKRHILELRQCNYLCRTLSVNCP